MSVVQKKRVARTDCKDTQSLGVRQKLKGKKILQRKKERKEQILTDDDRCCRLV